MIGEESSDEDQDFEDPEWFLAVTGGEARKDNSKFVTFLQNIFSTLLLIGSNSSLSDVRWSYER